MVRSGLKQRWMVVATVALALMTATTTTAINCNVTESDSDSGSASDSADSGDSVDFSTLDYDTPDADDGIDEAAGHQSCFEVALWCESLGTAVSPDPANNCKYPCPDITRD